MKRQEKHKSKPPFLWKERYLHADGYIKCDGCGEEKAISKGVTYLEHIAHDEDGNQLSTMNFCPRCVFAIMFRKASSKEAFEIKPMDLELEKQPNRFQSAWMRLRQRITKDMKKGVDGNDAWKTASEKLIDELGMRHVWEREIMLAKQAEQFTAAIQEIDKANARLARRLKTVRSELETGIDEIAKKRLALKNAMASGRQSDKVFEELVDAINNMRNMIKKI